MNLLGGDLGGTKTVLRLFTNAGVILAEEMYRSTEHGTFDEILHHFLQHRNENVQRACFAVAGPIIGETAQVTNLPWTLSSPALASTHDIGNVRLINDFYGVAASLSELGPDDLVVLNEGTRERLGARAVLGAGTGLGEAIVAWAENHWTILQSEGGHSDFGPSNRLQDELLVHLRELYGHVSWERVVSGLGIVDLYEFLRIRDGLEPSAIEEAADVESLADQGDAEAVAAMNLFIEAYGAEAGNLALKAFARGGVYIAGGIATKNLDRLTDGRFFRAFTNKGRFSELLESIPVYVIMNEKAGLIGACTLARA